MKIPGNNSNLKNIFNSRIQNSLRSDTSSKRKILRESLKNFQNKKIEAQRVEISQKITSNHAQNNNRDVSFDDDFSQPNTERRFNLLKR